MKAMEEAVTAAIAEKQELPVTEAPEDYFGDDGLLYCGVCRQRKQKRVRLFDRELTVTVMCPCRIAEVRKEQEEQERKERQLELKKLRDLSLMSAKFRDATFERYSLRPENEKSYRIASRYTEEFGKMYDENQGLLIYGPVGTGKSFTAACIANKLLDQGIAVVMTSFVKILQDIQNPEMDEREYLKMLDNARLLIIDDLGAERNTDYALEKVYNVIDSRVRINRPMILTTNLTLQAMKDETDIRYRRIYDRIFENCYPVQMTGRSYRTEEGNRRFLRMKELVEG